MQAQYGVPRVSEPLQVCVVGAGYVGLTAAACLAELGHRVSCLEADPARLRLLLAGGVPIIEADLPELVGTNRANGRLTFTGDPAEAVAGADVALLCVGTPPQPSGEPDLRQLAGAATAVARAATADLTIAVKSTVPPGTCEALELICADALSEASEASGATREPGASGGSGGSGASGASGAPVTVRVASNPEFLREGRAVQDFLYPDRVVIGADDPAALDLLRRLYPPEHPVVRCDRRSAELVKYASNTFLAVKISFANEVAALCRQLGADADAVLDGVGLDARIGRAFLGAGPGFGGACLPKDVSGLIAAAEAVGHPARIARAALAVNDETAERVVATVRAAIGRLAGARIAVLGLAFKPGTDDVRDAPALRVASALAAEGAQLSSHDPLAAPVTVAARRCADPYEAATRADAVVVLTGWPEYGRLDLYRLAAVMAGPAVIDTVGVLDAVAGERAGLQISRIGEGVAGTWQPVVVQPLHWAAGQQAAVQQAAGQQTAGQRAAGEVA